MKLFHLTPKEWFRVEGQLLFLDHLDGMYSYCKTPTGEIVHIAAWAEVEPADPPPQSLPSEAK